MKFEATGLKTLYLLRSISKESREDSPKLMEKKYHDFIFNYCSSPVFLLFLQFITFWHFLNGHNRYGLWVFQVKYVVHLSLQYAYANTREGGAEASGGVPTLAYITCLKKLSRRICWHFLFFRPCSCAVDSKHKYMGYWPNTCNPTIPFDECQTCIEGTDSVFQIKMFSLFSSGATVSSQLIPAGTGVSDWLDCIMFLLITCLTLWMWEVCAALAFTLTTTSASWLFKFYSPWTFAHFVHLCLIYKLFCPVYP